MDMTKQTMAESVTQIEIDQRVYDLYDEYCRGTMRRRPSWLGAADRLLQEEPRLMLNGIDHLVIVVPKLEAAIASYSGLEFDFLAPRSPESPLSAWLAARGPSPYAATLAAPSKGPLPTDRTLGARLSLG